jgi:hypothetical protein
MMGPSRTYSVRHQARRRLASYPVRRSTPLRGRLRSKGGASPPCLGVGIAHHLHADFRGDRREIALGLLGRATT